jgi:hypothetical protein
MPKVKVFYHFKLLKSTRRSDSTILGISKCVYTITLEAVSKPPDVPLLGAFAKSA